MDSCNTLWPKRQSAASHCSYRFHVQVQPATPNHPPTSRRIRYSNSLQTPPVLASFRHPKREQYSSRCACDAEANAPRTRTPTPEVLHTRASPYRMPRYVPPAMSTGRASALTYHGCGSPPTSW